MGKVEKIKIEDSVVVKDGIMCPDMESLSIAGWQGRVSEISDEDKEGILVEIEWDSITLRALTEDYIRQSEEEGPLKIGDRISVRGIDVVDDLYGVIVNVTFGQRKYAHPLCNIEALDKKSSNYQNVYDYVVWFANR
jgi:hypothetical protein